MKKQIIVIAGPTASGKTKLSVALAKKNQCPIISADSRQFYKEMSIGTAKPTQDEMEGVTHYFIDSHSVQYPLTAGQFETDVMKLLDQLFQKHNKVILVGGSGMFIDAVVFGTDRIPHSKELRGKWNDLYEKNGLSYLQEQLENKDPEYYNEVDKKNPVRLIRALEVIDLTKKKYSVLRKHTKKRNFNISYFVIDHPREKLYDRINSRVDSMIKVGLIEEVKSLIKFKNTQPLNTVGYKEIFEYLDNQISLEKAIDLIKKNTRNYAKRQVTWFKRNHTAKWIEYSTTSDMIKNIEAEISN